MSEDSGPSRRSKGPPGRIGPYRILQTLGEGGMGVVYEAEQTTPVSRRVALKVVRTGYDTREIVARFEAERQALAVMDHPNIARVYDAGTTEDGLPYFAMELVKGTPITEYCDSQTLSPEERLRLFVPVCRAIQHAHHKGVIHRDLKPSNVLVTIADNQPVPKVIDFGIAKAIGHDLTDKTLVTRLGQLMGTPEYMSPEQAEMTGVDIDTRTDIYSLGVMLYELLVGARPLDLRDVALVVLWKAIREQMPPTPSARLSTLPGDTQRAIAHYRRTDAADLRKTLRGDLDWVVMKALEKDRTRRYETANGLAVDVERFLRHEPVVARPPSASYRFRKFVRRHRAGVAAAVVALLAVSAGSAAAVTGMVRAKRAEDRAVAEAAAAREVADFLQDLFAVSDPGEARGNEITAREILDEGAARIRSNLEEQPITRARLMSAIGNVYSNLGLYDESQPLLERALEIREAELGPEHPDIAHSLAELGQVHTRRGSFDEAERLYLRSLEMGERLLGPDHLDVTFSLNELGVLYTAQGRYEEATTMLERALEVRERTLPEHDTLIAMSLNNLASVYLNEGRYPDAESLFEQVLEIVEAVRPPDHPEIAWTLGNLAAVWSYEGKYDDAEAAYVRALHMEERVFGPDHPDVGMSNAMVGDFFYQRGRYDDAAPYLQNAVAILDQRLDPDHPSLALALAMLARVRYEQGNQADAERLGRRALRSFRAIYEPGDVRLATPMWHLADVFAARGRTSEAEALYRESLAVREAAEGPEALGLAQPLDRYAALLRTQGRARAADSLEAKARGIRAAVATGDDEEASGN